MKWINKIAYHQNIRNEVPNQELAKELAINNNADGVKEIAEYLYDKNKSIASDCIKVIYETGYLNPELIADHVDTFLELLTSKNNRMIWGAMIALSTISQLKADTIFKSLNLFIETINKGTVITEVAGIKALTGVSLAKKAYKEKILPTLYDYLEACRPVDFAARVDTILPVLSGDDELEVLERIIELKSSELSDAQKKKLKAVINKYNKNKDSNLRNIIFKE